MAPMAGALSNKLSLPFTLTETMTKLSRTFQLVLSSSLLLFFPLAALAQSNALPMVLESEDPAKPLEIIDDHTWTGKDIQGQSGIGTSLTLKPFNYDATKGPVRLVVDYAATRATSEVGEALIDIAIECPEANEPCQIPIAQTVLGVSTEFMGESAMKIDEAPQSVWVARLSHTYTFPPDTLVSIRLSLLERKNLEPKAIRARLIYGDYDRSALPGQETRTGLFLKIAAAILLMLIAFFWWTKRQ